MRAVYIMAALVLALDATSALPPPAHAGEVTVRRYSRDLRGGELGYALRHRTLETILIGNPFAVPATTVAETLLPALRGAMRGGDVRFTAARADRRPSGYFAVLAFDPPAGVTLGGVCDDPVGLGVDRRPGELRMLALLCRGATPLAQVQGTMAPPDGPLDPALVDFARKLVRGLGPRWAFQAPQSRKDD
jgi:hypothetical protein